MLHGDRLPVAVVGASGYTGAELVRILLRHPRVKLDGLYAHSHAGELVAANFPQFAGRLEERYRRYSADDVAGRAKIVFLALPHGESVEVARELYARGLTVLDLSADFRLRSAATYQEWYGAHAAPELLAEARYGLVERHRESLRGARLIAVPGCYPTATLLALAPLLDAKLIRSDGIIVDAKSGVSGAGRSPQLSTHFSEAGEGVRAYKVAAHRHTPEIEQELERASGRPVRITFTPHLLPMSRGILSTCYAAPTDDARPLAEYHAALRDAYARESFVAVVERPPDTAHLRGSNGVQVAVFLDGRARRVIAMGAIDNLVKGAAGQAVQCLNAALGWPETEGLDGVGIFPDEGCYNRAVASPRRVPILAKLLGAYLIPTVATFAGAGILAHWVARRSLEEELGRRLASIAAAAAAEIGDENVALLQPGDEQTRTYRNLKKRLDELQQAAGVRRIYLFDRTGTSRCDTDGNVPIGERYYRLDADRAELKAAFAGTPTASVLFKGLDGALYKSGYAPLGKASEFAVGVDGAASLYEQLAGFRRTLGAVGAGGTLLVVALSIFVARRLVRPLGRLSRAAERIGAGELDTPVGTESRDEVGLVAETLEAMRLQLRSRDERMQMMLAGIAHEVRNPLGGMELYAGLLRDELASDEPRLELVRRIEREVGHLKTIVGDFLEYARRPKPELKPRDVAELLAEVRELAQAQAGPRGVRVELHAESARASCDSVQLRRALLNLAQNAVQACPTDGTGTVRLGCARKNGEVLVTVHDTGQGIAADAIDKIWTPFYTTKQSGTGLGLAFVREIARDHGARIDVESAPGRGTTFTLALPAAERAQS